MPELPALIEASVASWDNPVEQVVFGTDDPAAIAAHIEDFCAVELKASIAEALFYEASVGCVIGVRLDDHSVVVLKTYQTRWTTPFLTAVRHVQAHLYGAGFPCPRPRAGPLRLGSAVVMVEDFLPDPGPATIERPMLAVSARGLVRQISLCQDLEAAQLRPHPLSANDDSLYPEPHSPIFDFRASATGAEWIDELAVQAQRLKGRIASEPVIAHTDWSARNVRMDCERVLAVYDWDSVSLVPESVAVGQAAVTWSTRAEPGEVAPSVDEMLEYVHEYEGARGRAFSTKERADIGPAVVSLLAYAARCEHAVDRAGDIHHRARRRLATDGERLLAMW